MTPSQIVEAGAFVAGLLTFGTALVLAVLAMIASGRRPR